MWVDGTCKTMYTFHVIRWDFCLIGLFVHNYEIMVYLHTPFSVARGTADAAAVPAPLPLAEPVVNELKELPQTSAEQTSCQSALQPDHSHHSHDGEMTSGEDRPANAQPKIDVAQTV